MMRFKKNRPGVDDLLSVAAIMGDLATCGGYAQVPAVYGEVSEIAETLVRARAESRSRRETAEISRLTANLRTAIDKALPGVLRHLAGRLWRAHVDLQEASRHLSSVTSEQSVSDKIALLARVSDEMEGRIARLIRELAKPIPAETADVREPAKLET